MIHTFINGWGRRVVQVGPLCFVFGRRFTSPWPVRVERVHRRFVASLKQKARRTP